MSALAFQQVMSFLIRYPEQPLNLIRERLAFPELTDRELVQLSRMEVDPLVRKFGHKMSYCRKRDALTVMPLSKKSISEPLLDDLFHNHFERSTTTTDFVMLGVNFLEFLLDDAFSLAALAACPPFVIDFLRYEHAKAWVVRQPLLLADTSLPVGSRLAHRAFIMATVHHDVPALDRQRHQGQTAIVPPSPRTMKLLFLRTQIPPFYRMFQIDEGLGRYLEAQRKDPSCWQEGDPPRYGDLVKIGLCRNLT